MLNVSPPRARDDLVNTPIVFTNSSPEHHRNFTCVPGADR
jgi:hypothetical protein